MRRRQHNRLAVRNTDDAHVQKAADNQAENYEEYIGERYDGHDLNLPQPKRRLKARADPRARLLTRELVP